MITVTIFFVALFILVKVVRGWTKVNHLSSIPGPERRSFIFGNLDLFREPGKPLNYTIGQRLMGFSKLYQKEEIFKFYIGTKPIVCVFTPEAFKLILGTSAQIEKPDAASTLRHGLGNGLGTADGRTWKRNRKLLMPTFSTKVLNGYLPTFNHHSNVLCELIKKQMKVTGCINDVEHLTVNTSLDLICETAMGVKPGSNHNKCDQLVTESNGHESTKPGYEMKYVTQEMYTESLQKFTEILVKRIFSPWLQFDFIFFRTRLGKEFSFHVQRIHSFTERIIREKSSETQLLVDSNMNSNPISSRQVAFLDLLLQLKNQGLMDMEGIRAEVDTFTFAGHDTLAVTTAFALFEIGNNPNVQEKLFREVTDVFGSFSSDSFLSVITADNLNKLDYLDSVIKEVLRLYPAGPSVGRVLTRDVEFKNHLIPSGTEIWCLIAALHANPDVYTDPVQFNPDRFTKQTFGSFSFAPFSSGIRNCIGHRFALMAMKVLICDVIRRFKLTSIDTRDKLLINFELILRSKTKIRIKFDSRF